MAKVAIIKDNHIRYDCPAPFHPSHQYPEYLFKELSRENSVYNGVRDVFYRLGMDTSNYNTSSWNPLGKIIQPGDTVLLKPNLVRHYNPAGNLDCLFTHGSVIRAVLDYAAIALQGKGRIILGDAPLQNCDFAHLAHHNGIDKIIEFYNQTQSITVELCDFRCMGSEKYRTGFIERRQLPGDPSGYCAVDLKDQSELFEIGKEFERFRVTNYDKHEMRAHHNQEKNEYLIPRTVLEADVIINIPKLKTHRKAGMTGAMKNFVGINGCKDWLPHHRFGSIDEGGDEYLHRSARKKLSTLLYETKDVAKNRSLAFLLLCFIRLIEISARVIPYKDPYHEGSWYGNDTLPRTIADLNRIAQYADKNGILQHTAQRRCFVVVDAVIAGEKDGPLEPSPRNCGLIVAGDNPVSVDLVCSALMGFDYMKMPQFKYALKERDLRLWDENPLQIEYGTDMTMSLKDIYTTFGESFVATGGWLGHIER